MYVVYVMCDVHDKIYKIRLDASEERGARSRVYEPYVARFQSVSEFVNTS